MTGRGTRPGVVAATVALAAALWFVTFYLTWSTFWIKITFSSLALAILSLWLRPNLKSEFRFDGRAVILGMASAIALYLIFWAGKVVSTAIFPFAGREIIGIYDRGEGTPAWIIFPLLFFITGPCEEIYWRGYLQGSLMDRFGRNKGWFIAALFYAGVHISSLNFMLIGAAGVAGAFWGAMFRRSGNLAPVIISHALWSSFIFTVIPVP